MGHGVDMGIQSNKVDLSDLMELARLYKRARKAQEEKWKKRKEGLIYLVENRIYKNRTDFVQESWVRARISEVLKEAGFSYHKKQEQV